MGNSIKERRRSPRVNVSIAVDYSIKGTGVTKAAFAKNISTLGVCLVADEDIEPGAVLELKIYLPNDVIPISAKGRVAWENEVTITTKGRVAGKSEFAVLSDQRTVLEIGIEFVDISEQDLERISQFVFSLIPIKK